MPLDYAERAALLQRRAAVAFAAFGDKQERLAAEVLQEATQLWRDEFADLVAEPPRWLRDLAFAETPEERVEAIEMAVLGTFARGDQRWGEFPEDRPAERDWVLRHWVPSGCVSLFAGPGGGGKGFASLQMAAAVAAGATAVFPSDGPNKGPSVHLGARRHLAGILSAEDDTAEMARRLHGLPDLNGLAARDAVGPRLRLHRPAGPLWAERGPTSAMDVVAQGLDLGIRLLVLDNVGLIFNGNENDRGEVTEFVACLAGLAAQYKAGVIVIHHPSKGERGAAISGSTAWRNAVRAVLLLETELERKTKRRRTSLVLDKSNYGPSGNRVYLRLETRADGLGWREVTPDEAWRG